MYLSNYDCGIAQSTRANVPYIEFTLMVDV